MIHSFQTELRESWQSLSSFRRLRAAAMVFCVIAAYCSGRWIYEKKSILWALPAIGFMTWAFGKDLHRQACFWQAFSRPGYVPGSCVSCRGPVPAMWTPCSCGA